MLSKIKIFLFFISLTIIVFVLTKHAVGFDYVLCDGTVTNCNILNKPIIPRPQKGQTIIDPNFHTKITRITDRTIDGYKGASDGVYLIEPSYATYDIENSDGTKIILRSGCNYHLYDVSNINSPKMIKALHLREDGDATWCQGEPEIRWDPGNPNVFYYVLSMGEAPLNLSHRVALFSYNISNDQKGLVHDFRKEFPTATKIFVFEKGTPSEDGRYWAFRIMQDNTTIALVVYDKTIDKIVGTAQGVFDNVGGRDVTPNDTRWIGMTPSGKRVIWYSSGMTFPNSCPEGCNMVAYYDRNFVENGIEHWGAHSDIAIDKQGNEVFVVVGDYVEMFDIETGDRMRLFDMCPGNCPGAHVSSNQVITFPGWALVSFYAPANAFDWEKDLHLIVELDKNKCLNKYVNGSWVSCSEKPRVWRLAHTHAVGSDYWQQGWGTINKRGTRIYFGSNWDNETNDIDTYMIELPETWYKDLTGNSPPTVSASATPTSGLSPLTVKFTGSANDSDGTIVSYCWYFGDGSTSTEQNPTYVYNKGSNYTATLEVVDNGGAANRAFVSIFVGKNEPPAPPNSVKVK